MSPLNIFRFPDAMRTGGERIFLDRYRSSRTHDIAAVTGPAGHAVGYRNSLVPVRDHFYFIKGTLAGALAASIAEVQVKDRPIR